MDAPPRQLGGPLALERRYGMELDDAWSRCVVQAVNSPGDEAGDCATAFEATRDAWQTV